jgi:hypothetical protein
MQEDTGIQELYTRDHGTVKVDKKSWQDGGFHIVLCPNGAYQHSNGLPVRDEKELKGAFGSNKVDLDKALNWFKNRHDQLENPVRPIAFHADGYPIFADGSVPDFDDLYAFFKPGPILTAAIVALQQYNERKGTGAAPKELRKVAPPIRSEEEVKDAFRATTKPAPDPLKYSPIARRQAKDKAQKAAARVKAKAAKAAATG